MTTLARCFRRAAIAGALLLAGAASAAGADAAKCQQTILKESAGFVRALAKTLGGCELKRITGKLPVSTDCAAEAKTAAKVESARVKLRAKIHTACGGSDKTCGGSDDVPLAAIGWDIGACPGFEVPGQCEGAISDCDDIGGRRPADARSDPVPHDGRRPDRERLGRPRRWFSRGAAPRR